MPLSLQGGKWILAGFFLASRTVIPITRGLSGTIFVLTSQSARVFECGKAALAAVAEITTETIVSPAISAMKAKMDRFRNAMEKKTRLRRPTYVPPKIRKSVSRIVPMANSRRRGAELQPALVHFPNNHGKSLSPATNHNSNR
jgi:hypothetical protein